MIEVNNEIINKSNDYVIKGDSNVKVINNTVANIYDYSNESNISLFIEEGSKVNYFIVKSHNNKRTFDVEGSLELVAITVNKTNEELKINLNKENAIANVRNLVIAGGFESKFLQNATHNSVSTFSNIENIGIAFDKGNILFDTTGKIEKGKSKSKCSQLSRGIVMDNKSAITAKPILLIDEFDCFANHGASIGKMSDDDLFYLMSRGLTKDEAFLLILQGIVRPFIESIPNTELKEEIDNSVSKLILK